MQIDHGFGNGTGTGREENTKYRRMMDLMLLLVLAYSLHEVIIT